MHASDRLGSMNDEWKLRANLSGTFVVSYLYYFKQHCVPLGLAARKFSISIILNHKWLHDQRFNISSIFQHPNCGLANFVMKEDQCKIENRLTNDSSHVQ